MYAGVHRRCRDQCTPAYNQGLGVAIFHFSMSIVRRCAPENGAAERARRKASWAKGGTEKDRSAVGAAAYRAGVRLQDLHDGRVHDYSRRHGVVGAEILLPAHAPAWMADRGRLWNAAELSEQRYDARVAREINVAIPVELPEEARKSLVRDFVLREIVGKGMAADVAYHEFASGNPHAHVMMSLRSIDSTGFGQRLRILDTWGDRSQPGRGEETWVAKLRSAWSEACNEALQAVGRAERIDHRSLVAQGVAQLATVHLGPKWTTLNRENPATPMERRDKRTQANHAVERLNTAREQAWLSMADTAAASRTAAEHYGRLLEGWRRRYGREGIRWERLAALEALGDSRKPEEAMRRSQAYQRRRSQFDTAQQAVPAARRRRDEAASRSSSDSGIARQAAQAYADAVAFATAIKEAWIRWLAMQRKRWERLFRLRAETLEEGRPALLDRREMERRLLDWAARLRADGSVSREAPETAPKPARTRSQSVDRARSPQ